MPKPRRLAAILAALALCLAAPAPAQLQPPRDTKGAMKHYKQGKAALAQEQWQEAEEEFRRAAGLDPLLVGAHYGLGQTMMATRRFPEAVKAFEAARDAFKQAQAVSAEDEALTQRRIDDQIRALQDDISSARRSGGSTSGSVQAAIDRNEEQIKTLQGLRNRGGGEPLPTPHWLSFALGSAWFRAGDLAEAEAGYRAALAQKPDLGEGHLNLGVVCMLTGRLDEAAAEVALAEKAGVKVPQGLKDELAKRRQAGARP
jgi:tetratricopeptide (TPR) repeat protein